MQAVDLGTPWIANPFGTDDLMAELLLVDGTVQTINVTLNGPDIASGDIAGTTVNDPPDGIIDVTDWLDFRRNQNTDLAGLSIAQAYQRGDLDGDLDSDLSDFVAFETAYNVANGAGAFQDMIASIPEPGSRMPSAFALAGTGALRRRRCHRLRTTVIVLVAGCVLLSCPQARADVFAAYDAGPTGGGPADLDPELQGWIGTDIQTMGTLGMDANAGALQPDGGTGFNSWQINDVLTDSAFDRAALQHRLNAIQL